MCSAQGEAAPGSMSMGAGAVPGMGVLDMPACPGKGLEYAGEQLSFTAFGQTIYRLQDFG
jgi:hypothetical protein